VAVQAAEEPSGAPAREQIVRAVASSHGDDELLQGLVRIARETHLEDEPSRQEYVHACEKLRSGEARARALKTLLVEAPISPDTGHQVLAAARKIEGDDSLLATLKTMDQIRESDLIRGPLAMDYLAAAERLHSEDALAASLVWLLHPEPIAREGVMRAMELASARLHGDELRHKVLVEVTDHQELDPAMKARALQLASALRDEGLKADAKKRLEHSRDCDDDGRKSAVNIRVGRVPIRVQVDGEEMRRQAEEMAREAERVGREAAREAQRAGREAQRAAQEAVRHQQLRERARQEAEEARRQFQQQAEQLKQQARQLSEQLRERTRKLKQKLSKELPPEDVEELNLDELDEMDWDL
ncbi:MAG TPA: hypothetical protein VND93_25430, partial [Myxococcales bacterium]|nr:hypothetical protein [Myxococcales bacterium]